MIRRGRRNKVTLAHLVWNDRRDPVGAGGRVETHVYGLVEVFGS